MRRFLLLPASSDSLKDYQGRVQLLMAASSYAALLAVARSLREILDLEQCSNPHHKEKIVSLKERVDSLVTFLEDYSDKHHETFGQAGNRIRKAAYEAQDFMDSYLCLVSATDDGRSSSEASFDKENLDQDLNMAFERIDFIWEEAKKMNNSETAQDSRSRFYSSPVDLSSTARNRVVGFDDDLNAIKERLYEGPTKLQIIPIVGMGGMGKTTLARRAYEDSLFSQYFDLFGWITVSQEYQRGEVLSRLLQSLDINEQSNDDKDEAELAKRVYQKLIGRRYLIVIDDIWSIKAWDDLKMIFPDDGCGGRILLTTRLSDVGLHAGTSSSPIHQMSLLNEDQSWRLLQEMVFRQESCPLRLVEIGKKVAKNCGGLPLTIVVVAGLLLSMGSVMEESSWESISEKISSTEPTIALQCTKILCLSYDRLPLRLKPCFLYISAFPEDSEIDVSKLIKLWVAEGFLKPNDRFKCLEDVGECYLDDLVNRSLLLVSKKGPDGKPQTVGIHDMLREICIAKAEEDGFLHCVSSKTNSPTDIEKPYRRLHIQAEETEYGEWNNVLVSSVRSILLYFPTEHDSRLHVCARHIVVLDEPRVTWSKLPDIISTFVNLRYFAFAPLLDSPGVLQSISKLPNLETIVVHPGPGYQYRNVLRVPYEILRMPKLRHLICYGFCKLFGPSDIGINIHESGLRTLQRFHNFIFAEEIIKTALVNLKKLVVTYYIWLRDWDIFHPDNLFHLQNLEDLRILMVGASQTSLFVNLHADYRQMIWNHAFPIGLKKLYLYRVRFSWGNMTTIGSLPVLQVLEMMDIVFGGTGTWTTIEGQFLELKYFRSSLDSLEKWETEKEHFPCLGSLILEGARAMNEIPSGIGEIDSLQYIELKRCPESLVNSAKQIQKQQHENGNDAFRVCVIDL